MTTSTHTTCVWPTLVYRDARAAIRFLVDAFGFEERAAYGEGDRVDHAELGWPKGGGIMLGSPREDSVISDLPPGTGSVYLAVDDPDALHERAVAAGATIVRGLRDEDYGSRGFTCRDPEGVFWSFGTYAGA
ncbi:MULTISPECIES: VOC family protein [unclassified Rhodococcus (in: high G+C Gram-positive bacteria)]|uniref:VOC family protein n=1 Tax=unclassified Rhodococcus (in: high G+C Gram-positive bacteria) TaxID=192944 RepID=UPI00163A837F|nr:MULTISPECIES: VOC family protein [unclassified Rhodococcus (in: high G+C Gram-positive bacteria)]MBC2643242.1 VOC family protein [Rhodococcus sp. 3A]MBC2892017.1 VOC family protein [Rhodococcus sp. 4CII]